ncbi:YncE family protein [Streptomyces sp. NPDC059525]|uniref:YncE family protein n=1 Tax=Streptomyces sp. NPDC059525 TaxID=3346857 RepID=UPI0036878EEA
MGDALHDAVEVAVVDEVKVGSDPVDVVVSPDGRRVYVANSGYGSPASLSVIDTATDMVIGWPGRPGDFRYGLAVTPSRCSPAWRVHARHLTTTGEEILWWERWLRVGGGCSRARRC